MKIFSCVYNHKCIWLFIAASICLLLPHRLVCANEPMKIRYSDNTSKIIRLSSEETVTINGILYKIPPQWKGKKINGPTLIFDDFAPIPKDATWQGSALYVLKETAGVLAGMIEDAKKDGVYLVAHSAYRSRGYQTRIFVKLMEAGRSFDDLIRYVAPPGYSEHMLGTVVDFYPSNWKFASTSAYAWLKKNASGYDFFETYPETGSAAPWEPWHWNHIPEEMTSERAEQPQQISLQ